MVCCEIATSFLRENSCEIYLRLLRNAYLLLMMHISEPHLFGVKYDRASGHRLLVVFSNADISF